MDVQAARCQYSFVSTQVVSRLAESRAVDDLLAAVSSGPAALMVEGEAGIGKTTMWLAALERARELGFRVLSSRATAAESVLAYSSLADLLEELDESAFAHLPPPQRLAIDRVSTSRQRRRPGNRSGCCGSRVPFRRGAARRRVAGVDRSRRSAVARSEQHEHCLVGRATAYRSCWVLGDRAHRSRR